MISSNEKLTLFSKVIKPYIVGSLDLVVYNRSLIHFSQERLGLVNMDVFIKIKKTQVICALAFRLQCGFVSSEEVEEEVRLMK